MKGTRTSSPCHTLNPYTTLATQATGTTKGKSGHADQPMNGIVPIAERASHNP